MSRRLTILVLVCSLPLILPRGWCCLFAGPVRAALKKLAAPRPGRCPCTGASCCSCAGGCCCSCAVESAPARHGKPDTPRPVKHCPCSDRDTTLPSGPEKCDADLLPPDPVIGPSLPVEPPPIFARATLPFPSPPPPLHVLKCLWLC